MVICISLLTLSSVLIPWVTLREVPVEVEIVSSIHFALVFDLLIVISRRQELPFFDSTAVCSKDSWAESVELLSWNIMPSESLARAENHRIIT